MPLIETLKELVAEGEKLAPQGGNTFAGYNDRLQPDYVSWRHQATIAIEQLESNGRPMLKDLEADKHGPYFYQSSAQRVLGALKAAVVLCERQEREKTSVEPTLKVKKATPGKEIFLVHGHEKLLLEQTARFLEKLELKPIILFEQPGEGQTIIEKLEKNCAVSYAVVLLTPDDVGKAAKEDGEVQPRARQNVILELGFFIGKLSRSNVVVLYDESVELPSDYRGVEYIKIDAEGAWRMKLAREIKHAGLSVDMNKSI